MHAVVAVADNYTASMPADIEPGVDPFVRDLLSNPRLSTTTAWGCTPRPDLTSGRLDLRVLSLLAVLVDQHRIRVSCIRTGHAAHVSGTNRVSAHAVWRAVDIDMVDGQQVSRRSGAARVLLGWLDRLDGPLRPAEIGSPFDLGRRPYFTDEDHRGHIHMGYTIGYTRSVVR